MEDEEKVMRGEEEQRLRNCERMIVVKNQDEENSKSQKGEKKGEDEVEVGSGNQVMGKVVEEEEKER